MSLEDPVGPVVAPEVAPQASFARRYAAKLAANIGGLAIGAAVILVVPRSLGAADYGLADYLLVFFMQVAGILDIGTSIGFYAWLSRRPDDVGLVRAYYLFVVSVALATILLVVLAFGAGRPAIWFWPGVAISYVLCGALAGWLTWAQQVSQKVFDARALTLRGEMIIFSCKLAGAALLVLLMLTQTLHLRSFLAYMILLPLVTNFVLLLGLRRETMGGRPFWQAVWQARPDWPSFARDFHPYVVPLLGFTVIANFSTMADRTLLEHFGGSFQQGLFALGNRIAVLCFVFSGAMTQLLTREIAIAWDREDRAEVGRLFSRYVPPLYALSALIAGFVAVHAREVVILLGGAQFAAGAAAMVVVAFYPLHQTLGQLTGSVFFATAKTRTYGRIGIAAAAISLPTLWLLVAPAALGGQGLGALGLAIKLVAVQALMVNVALWFICRDFPVRFGRQLLFQLLSPAIACALALAARLISSYIPADGIEKLLLSGLAYAVLVLVATLAVPFGFGIDRSDRHYALTHAKGWIFSTFRRGI